MAVRIPPRAGAVVAQFEGLELDADQRAYLRMHAARYEHLVRVARPRLDALRARRAGEPLRILDVGISFLTELLRREVPDGQVDDLGRGDPVFKTPAGAHHIRFELNDARRRDLWPDLGGRYDMIVMSETIEHLWVGPATILGCLASGLAPDGYLIIQTPNAVALHKRLRMLLGRPPVAPLPEGDCPGLPHLHEYTIAELVRGGERAGLVAEAVSASNYFGGGPAARAYAALGRALPASMRHGLTLAFRPVAR